MVGCRWQRNTNFSNYTFINPNIIISFRVSDGELAISRSRFSLVFRNFIQSYGSVAYDAGDCMPLFVKPSKG